MSVLDEIIVGVGKDLAARKSQTSLADLVAAIASAAPPRTPLPAFRAPGLSVIAEVKRSSPSKGALADIPQPEKLAADYQAGGAAAISVLTESKRFAGSLTDLDQVRQAVDLPILRKDFIIDEYQVYETRAYGADMILLIVAALSDEELTRLFTLSTKLGLTVLVEVHDELEARRACELGAELVGVNNRNLKTLTVDLSQFSKIVKVLGDDVVKVAESGILVPEDAARLASEGADVVLVGEALVKHKNPRQAVRDLIGEV